MPADMSFCVQLILWADFQTRNCLKKYGIEPYVIAGDGICQSGSYGTRRMELVYRRCGMVYRTVLEQLIGYNEQGNPLFCWSLISVPHSANIRSRFKSMAPFMKFFVHTAAEFSVLIDGIRLPDICSEESLSFEFDGESHKVGNSLSSKIKAKSGILNHAMHIITIKSLF